MYTFVTLPAVMPYFNGMGQTSEPPLRVELRQENGSEVPPNSALQGTVRALGLGGDPEKDIYFINGFDFRNP